MGRIITGGAQILDMGGALVLDLNDEVAYRLADFSDDEVRLDRVVISHPRVDGDQQVGPGRRVSTSKTVAVRILGTSWAQVEQRRGALFAAVEFHFLLRRVLQGVSETWRASPAEISSAAQSEDIANNRRIVYLTVPVQPTSVITFPEEP